jgi:hypothetical protein
VSCPVERTHPSTHPSITIGLAIDMNDAGSQGLPGTAFVFFEKEY